MPGTRKWTEEDLRRELPKAKSLRQLAVALGLSPGGGQSYAKVKAEIARLGLSTEHFLVGPWNKGTGAGRNPQAQRDAKKRWYDNNRGVYRDRNADRRRERVYLLRKKKDRPCMDCGRSYPYFVMEFDHRDGEDKSFSIGTNVALMVPLAKFLAEIDKCDVVCVLCHRFRTARRAGWDEADGELADDLVLLAEDS